jgi:hypothetical protein
VSLDARIFDSGNYNTPPVAPPRKKRSTLKKGSTLPVTLENGGVKNGFKDVFVGGAVKSLSFEEEPKRQENVIQTRVDVEEHKESTLERKLKIGNKKSDKFFGESLSDHLSDEPVDSLETPNKDEIDRSSTSEKKLFFLMNMLDRDQEDDIEKYKGKNPVEEPLFVAKKKVTKHICDDDNHMHSKLFYHEREAPPPKPERDFSKYQEILKESNFMGKISPEKSVATPTQHPRTRRTISRENLPTPPDTPKRKSGAISLPGTPTITIETIEFNSSNDDDKHENTDEVKKVEVNKVEASKSVETPQENGKKLGRGEENFFLK